MSSFELSADHRQDLALIVAAQALAARSRRFADLCEAVLASISAYEAERMTRWASGNDPELRRVAQLLLQKDPSVGLIRARVAGLPEATVRRIEAMALRRSEQIPMLRPLASGLREWAKHAVAANIVPVLRLCLVDGGMVVPGRLRPNGKQSAPRFEAMMLGQGRGLQGVPKPKGGRPADDAEVRLISLLAADWLLVMGLQPEPGRDGHSPFSRLVYDVFGWLGIGSKAQHCLRQYWALVGAGTPVTSVKLV